MKLAIMQPYLFPYLGYFQLMHAVDTFIIYDDVNYMKKGWINRNYIRGQDEHHALFTVPLYDVSQNRLIKDTLLHESYPEWRNKFLRTLQHTYAKAPFYPYAADVIEDILYCCEPGDSISFLCLRSFQRLAGCLGLRNRTLQLSSHAFENTQSLSAQDRILAICQQASAKTYINLNGGRALYDSAKFKEAGIDLLFHKMKPNQHKYFHSQNPFQPPLSIIDILMYCSNLEPLITAYELLP